MPKLLLLSTILNCPSLAQAQEECRTFERFRPHFAAAVANADGACPIFGSPDLPSVRNAAIPAAGTPIKTVRLRLNVFANADGSNSAATQATVDQLMAEMNGHYRTWRIAFTYTTRFINDSRFRSLALSEETQMKSLYAAEPDRQHNVYVVNIEAGYNGWGTFPFDSIALTAAGGTVVDDNAFTPGRTTLSHELGHGLGLWHTHHGVSEVNACTACFESPGAASGDMTGDFCSDTPPTPVSWSCGNPGGTDACSGRAWGATDYLNFMSYSSCRSRFTPQQAGRMHAWIAERLSTWLVASTPEIAVWHGGTPLADGQSAAVDFGTVMAGQSGPTRTFTVRNMGAASLALGAVSVPPGFIVTEALWALLTPGEQDTFTVRLDTATAGVKSGRISIPNNDADENPFDFPITGMVGQAPVEVEVSLGTSPITDGQATPIDFGRAIQGQSGLSRTFTVRNVGGQTLTLGLVSVPASFTLSKGLPASLTPGQQDTFAVALNTTTVGTKTGQIVFANNDSDESPFNFPITGAVSPPPTLVYVDGVSNCANPDGSLACPFKSFCNGYDSVAPCGTVRIHAGSYTTCQRLLTKCGVFESYGGRVTLLPPGSGGASTEDRLAKLSAPTRLADGSFVMHFAGVPGQRYQVFTSTNLVSWELWKDFTAETDTLDFVDPEAALTPMRFFKVLVP